MKNKSIEKAILIAGSQAALAEKVGMSQTAISKLLNKPKAGMKLKTAMKIFKQTGVTLEELNS